MAARTQTFARAVAPTSSVQLLSCLAMLVVVAILPLAGIGSYWQGVVITSLYLGILALAWNLLSGFTGLFSLAPAGFSMLGAYVPAMTWTYLHWPPVLGILLAVVLTTGLGMVIGLLTLRLSGPYLALTTLALAEILHVLALNSFDITGGEIGLNDPPLFGQVTACYEVFAALTAVIVTLLHLLMRSSFGLYLRAIHNDEVGARARGVRTVFWKVFAFSASSGLSGLAGAMFGHYVVIVSPSLGNLFVTGEVISMVVIGGIGTLVGPLLGALLINVSSEFLRAIGDFQNIAFALVVILFARFCREGIVGRVSALIQTRRRIRVTAEHTMAKP
jgi:branched-chain amino acid transport system permease protein